MTRHAPFLTAALLLLVRALPAQLPPSPIVARPAEEVELRVTQSYVGTVRPSREVDVSSTVAGLVVDYVARRGQTVKAGQVLARLRTRTVEIDLARAHAELALEQTTLRELENGSRPQEITIARSKLAAARADLVFREWTVDQVVRRVASGAAAEDVLQMARFELERAKATADEWSAQVSLLEEGPRKETIEAARQRVAARQEEVHALEDALERHAIVAPFDAQVTAELAESGTWLVVGAPVYSLAALDEVEIEVPVTEDFVGRLKAGDEATVAITHLPMRDFTGRIHSILAAGDARTRTFPVRIRVPNEMKDGDPLLKSGMSAEVTLRASTVEKALVVPKDAVVLGGPQPMVWVLQKGQKDTTVRAVPIRLGRADGDRLEVTGELMAGDLVVTEGNERLRPGATVIELPKPSERPAGDGKAALEPIKGGS